MSKIIAVVGITGTQGASVADTYLQTPGWTVRGLTRNTSSEAAKQWATKGVRLVKIDLDDVESLKSAFAGADVIFGMTDYWTIWAHSEEEKEGKSELDFLKWVGEKEEQQARNLADAAASVPGLHRYIFSSMANATETSGGKYNQLFHMDSKARAVKYAQSLPGLNDKFSQIQAPIYFDLLWKWGLPTTPTKQADGAYRLKGPGPTNIPIPFGDVRRDFGQCVKAVADGAPNLNFFAVGDYLTWEEALRTFCKTQNVPYGGADPLTYEEITKILPGGLGHEFGLNVLFANEFGYEGNDPAIVTPDKLGIQMITWQNYCERTDFSSIL